MIKNVFLTILLSFLILISFFFMIYSKVLNQKALLNELNKIDYYSYVYNELKDNLESELQNIELSHIYESYINQSQIKKDINEIVNSYYNNESNSVKANFYNYLLDNFDNVNDEHVKTLATNLSNTYYNNLFGIDKLDKLLTKLPFKTNIKLITIFSLFVTIFLLMTTFFSKNNISFYNSLIISGIIFIVPKLFIQVKNILANFYYYNKSFSYFIRMRGYTLINTYFRYGFIILIIGLLGLIVHFINEFKLTKNVEWCIIILR